MKKCWKQCLIWPFIKEGNKNKEKDFSWYLNNTFNFKSDKNIVYMTECKILRFKTRYIGKREIDLHNPICEHIGDIKTIKLEKKTVAKHFYLPGHPLSDMTVTVMEKVKV